jgi:hypothetical protein
MNRSRPRNFTAAGAAMRRTLLLLIAALGLSIQSGCTWDVWRHSILGSLYSSYGDGYGGDRLTDFDDRYEQQSRAAAEYEYYDRNRF